MKTEVDILDWDEEIDYLDDKFNVKYHEDGSRTMQCLKNKRGFKATIHIGGTDEERLQAAEAVKRFYIHNML